MKQRSLLISILLILVVAGVYFIHTRGNSDLVSSPTACVNNPLAASSNGHCVSDAQNLLNWALFGIDGPNYKTVNGQFSTTTTTDVKQFQTDNNLAQTGALNVSTWQKLCQATDPPSFWLTAAKDAGCKT